MEDDDANDGGLIMSVVATSLPSLLDLESTLRLFNLRLWNKLMVIVGQEGCRSHHGKDGGQPKGVTPVHKWGLF